MGVVFVYGRLGASIIGVGIIEMHAENESVWLHPGLFIHTERILSQVGFSVKKKNLGGGESLQSDFWAQKSQIRPHFLWKT